jgi:hypothetical protein
MILGEHAWCDCTRSLEAVGSGIAVSRVRRVNRIAEVDIRVKLRHRKRGRGWESDVASLETVRSESRRYGVWRSREHGRMEGALGVGAGRVTETRFGDINRGRLAGKGHSDARSGSLSRHDVERKQVVFADCDGGSTNIT